MKTKKINIKSQSKLYNTIDDLNADTNFITDYCITLINHAIDNDLLDIKLAEIFVSEIDATVNLIMHRDQWENMLINMMDILITREKYEDCAKIKNILEKLQLMD